MNHQDVLKEWVCQRFNSDRVTGHKIIAGNPLTTDRIMSVSDGSLTSKGYSIRVYLDGHFACKNTGTWDTVNYTAFNIHTNDITTMLYEVIEIASQNVGTEY